MNAVPDTYLGQPVPEDIREQWRRWEGAAWRRMRHMGTGELFPPDQRFSVRLPEGMCQVHREIWAAYRNMRFNPVTGDRWPGTPGSPFIVVGHDLGRVREERRVEWDEMASDQMRQTEDICLSGRSPQCDRPAPAQPFVSGWASLVGSLMVPVPFAGA